METFICAMGVGDGHLIGRAMTVRGQLDLTLTEKQIIGTLYGSGNPRADIPKILGSGSARSGRAPSPTSCRPSAGTR